jgi:hypothetical protein
MLHSEGRIPEFGWSTDDMKITIRRSKTDQEGSGQVIAIPLR